MSHAYTLPHGNTVGELITTGAQCLEQAGVGFGHGTSNAEEEAIWLVLFKLGLPIDAPLGDEEASVENQAVTPEQQALVATLFKERIETRKPAAYLTNEAWLMGVPFYIDERSIVPRSFIAELLADGSIDHFLSDKTKNVLDLCTGNGSLACLAAMAYPEVNVTGADISTDALAVARINVDKHGLQERVTLVETDGLSKVPGPWDLILCNPPYVNADSMSKLPAEYLAEPELALAGGTDGMDFIRQLFADAPACMTEDAVLVLEIGNERPFFEAAFPEMLVYWLDTSVGEDAAQLLHDGCWLAADLVQDVARFGIGLGCRHRNAFVGQMLHQIQVKGQLLGAQALEQGQHPFALVGGQKVVGVFNTTLNATQFGQLTQGNTTQQLARVFVGDFGKNGHAWAKKVQLLQSCSSQRKGCGIRTGWRARRGGHWCRQHLRYSGAEPHRRAGCPPWAAP